MNKDTFAVIETGGKQYLVRQGEALQIEKLPKQEGETYVFDKILLVVEGKKITIGKPYIEGATIEAEIVAQKRARKIRILRYHSKTRTRRRKGHRQPYTAVKITK